VHSLVAAGVLRITGRRRGCGANEYLLVEGDQDASGQFDESSYGQFDESRLVNLTSPSGQNDESRLVNLTTESKPLIKSFESNPLNQSPVESNQGFDSDLIRQNDVFDMPNNKNKGKSKSKGPASTEGLDGNRESERASQPSSVPPTAQPNDTEAPAPRPAPAPPSPIAATLLALPHVGARLTAKDAESLAAWLRKDYGEDKAEALIGVLDEKQLAIMAAANNPAGYLRQSMKDGHWEASIRRFSKDLPRFRTGEYQTVTFPSGADHPFTTYSVRIVREVLGEEFNISELKAYDQGSYVDVVPRQTLAGVEEGNDDTFESRQ